MKTRVEHIKESVGEELEQLDANLVDYNSVGLNGKYTVQQLRNIIKKMAKLNKAKHEDIIERYHREYDEDE